MQAVSISTPKDTLIPTIESAIAQRGSAVHKFVTSPLTPLRFLEHLNVHDGFAKHLWQGAVHLRHPPSTANSLGLKTYADKLRGEWASLERAIKRDEIERGYDLCRSRTSRREPSAAINL